MLGHGVDLTSIKSDTYVVGGFSDHLTPWTGLLPDHPTPGRAHRVRALPHRAHPDPGLPARRPKAHYFTGPTPPADPEMWRAQSTRNEGTWWDHWADWVIARAGDEKPAAKRLGSTKHPVLVPAPGTYVHQPA